jgi:hypothetical protein
MEDKMRKLLFVLSTAIALAFGINTHDASAHTTSAATPAAATTPASLNSLTVAFTTFFTDVLAGRVPSGNLTAAMKAALTPVVVSQIDSMFSSLGGFQKLQYVRQDALQGYQRYHYVASFDKGQMGIMFVTDANGALAGFFKDPTTNG